MTTGPLGIIKKRNFPCLVALSRVTCGPKMTVHADYPPAPRWGGSSSLPEDAIELVRRLVDFMESSLSAVSIVYLGWGSMPAPDPVHMIRLARPVRRRVLPGCAHRRTVCHSRPVRRTLRVRDEGGNGGERHLCCEVRAPLVYIAEVRGPRAPLRHRHVRRRPPFRCVRSISISPTT
jgi:hypothetical protein